MTRVLGTLPRLLNQRWVMLPSGMLLFFSMLGFAQGAGFDSRYSVHVGDVNGDGSNEIYVKAPPTVVIPLDDIPIVIGPAVREFVLKSNGQAGFTIDSQLSSAEKAAASLLPASNLIDVFIRDVDLDGSADLELVGISSTISGHFDQIVYSPTASGRAPSSLTAKNTKFSRYHEHLFSWLQNNNYFDQNAPRKITSVEPGQRWWFGSIADSTNAYLANKWLADCGARNPSYYCALSDRPPPPPCERTTPQYDDAGNYVGTGTANICEKPLHVIIYAPDTITVSPDYSVFDPDARETADILSRINASCPAIATTDAERLAQIAEMIYQHAILRDHGVADRMNSFAHASFPGDELFNTLDKTYHHYDVHTRICGLTEPGCVMGTVRDDVARRSLSEILCLRHNMTDRSQYADQTQTVRQGGIYP